MKYGSIIERRFLRYTPINYSQNFRFVTNLRHVAVPNLAYILTTLTAQLCLLSGELAHQLLIDH